MSKNLSLKEIITCAMNALEAGVDSKQEAVNEIESYVNEHYISNSELEVVPMEVYEGTDQQGRRFRVAGVAV